MSLVFPKGALKFCGLAVHRFSSLRETVFQLEGITRKPVSKLENFQIKQR